MVLWVETQEQFGWAVPAQGFSKLRPQSSDGLSRDGVSTFKEVHPHE